MFFFIESRRFSSYTLEVTLNIVVVCVLHHGMNYTEASKGVKTKCLRKKYPGWWEIPSLKGNNICESISSTIKCSINVSTYSALLEENQLSRNANNYRADFVSTVASYN